MMKKRIKVDEGTLPVTVKTAGTDVSGEAAALIRDHVRLKNQLESERLKADRWKNISRILFPREDTTPFRKYTETDM